MSPIAPAAGIESSTVARAAASPAPDSHPTITGRKVWAISQRGNDGSS
jgi:hypothetical protein